MPDPIVADVSDTALWVAYFRAVETDRSDALIRDPLAKRLVGDRGRVIAERIGATRYVSWSVVLRTYVIDSYIRELLQEGVDTVLNLGAGLDTRPYRLDLPPQLRWIEVDYAHMIDHKERYLSDQTPRCLLERVRLDLANRAARREYFNSINETARRVIVLTEGVLPYLTNDQAADLAEDLRRQERFGYWITDYFAPVLTRWMRGSRMRKQLKNAPFLFEPENWDEFFRKLGWQAREKRYLGVESERLGRPIPMPWWLRALSPLLPTSERERIRRFSAYVLLVPSPAK